MSDDFVVKHNLKGALFLGGIITISLMIILMIPKVFEISCMKKISMVQLFVIIMCIGIYIVWSNYYLRKIIVEEGVCTYVNMVGWKKKLSIDDIGEIIFKDNDNVFLYENNGKKFCKIESNMINLDRFCEYLDYKRDEFSEIMGRDKLEEKIQQYFMDFIDCWMSFLSGKKKLGIVIEYGLQMEEREKAILYFLKFRVKNEESYLSGDFLRLGIWEYTALFLGYNLKTQVLFLKEREKLQYDIEDFYRKLLWIKENGHVAKRNKVTPLILMEQYRF